VIDVDRYVVLDTETTGLNVSEGHRVIEIGAVEVVKRRLTGANFHVYLNPGRAIDEGAKQVHGIDEEFLADKPAFENVAKQFVAFVEGAHLVIHNAPFDIGFLDHELSRLPGPKRQIADVCQVLDSLDLARELHPGQRNSLDALCSRYEVDNSNRTYHGALLDAEILAEVFLRMTGGQVTLALDAAAESNAGVAAQTGGRRPWEDAANLPVLRASDTELAAHEEALRRIDAASGGRCVWRTATD
jgi:DNA polymerase-3 subunit epsilon